MSKPIVPDPHSPRNPQADLICPHCHAQCRLTRRRLICPACAWAVRLTRTQATEIREALAGVTDLPLPAYLLVLATAPPWGGAFAGWCAWPLAELVGA